MKRLYHHIGDKIMNTIEVDPQSQKILTEYGSYQDSESLRVVYDSIKKLQKSFIGHHEGLKFVDE